MKTMGKFSIRSGLILLSSVVYIALGEAAQGKVIIVEGTATLGIDENVPPISCWVEEDCKPGEVCHMSVTIEGPPLRPHAELLGPLETAPLGPEHDKPAIVAAVALHLDGLAAAGGIEEP